MSALSTSRGRGTVLAAAAAVGLLTVPTAFLGQRAPGATPDVTLSTGTGTLAGNTVLPAAAAPAAPEGVAAAAGWATAAAMCVAMGTVRSRMGSSVARTAEAEKAPAEAAKPEKPKKVRISAFDSIRFFLIAYIVCGHFGSFAAPSKFAFKAITQINVVVGAFFVLSGYVAAYTTTELREMAASPKLLSTPTPKWILQRVFGYYPLHLIVCLIFAPMFMYPDVLFSGWPTAIWHAFLALTMTQAWFPMHAEVWNAPTWFLSALTFAMAILPFSLKIIAKQSKEQLRRTLGFIFLVGLIPKIGYCYDNNAWGLLEGAMAPKAMPNLAIFNTQRFNPFYALVEVLMGAVACRLVMLDDAEGQEPAPKVNAMSTLAPVLGMVGIILLRAFGVIHLSDMLTRACIFIPLFLKFMMSAHRASVLEKVTDPLVKILSGKFLTTLGGLAFPIFIVHGPLGQLFYKKIIASKLFGGPMHIVAGPWFFYVYLAIVMGAAWVITKTFLGSKKVGEIAGNTVNSLSEKL